MRYSLAVLFVFAAVSPALGRELITRHETPIYEKQDLKSKVLGRLGQNVKIASDQQKGFWFRVSVKIDGKTITGWVSQMDVDTIMGRSKGQLLAENRRLWNELTERRKREIALKAELAHVRAECDKVQAELARALDEIKRLKTAKEKE